MAVTGRRPRPAWRGSDEPSGSELGREISRAMVALFKEYVGRGPTQAHTHVLDELVVTVLHDTMTKGERTLTREDQGEAVRSVRRLFQGAFRDDAIEIVERLTGRPVLAFLSDHAVDPDYAIEAFVLGPGLDEDEATREAGPAADPPGGEVDGLPGDGRV